MRYWRRLLLAFLFFTGSGLTALTMPITYVFSGKGGGSLDMNNFSGNFTVVITTDTDNIRYDMSSSGEAEKGINSIVNLAGAITLEGLGKFNFSSPLYMFVNQNNHAVGFGDFIHNDLIDVIMIGVGLNTYELDKSFGPITDSAPTFFQFRGVQTSGGSLTFTSMAQATFSAQRADDISVRLTPTPAALNFLAGTRYAVDVENGGKPTTRTLTLTNTGNAPVVFTGGATGTLGLAITGRRAADFKIDRVTPSTSSPLEPGASVTVTLRFAPTATRRTLGLDAALTVTCNSATAPTLNIPLLGDAVPVELSGFEAQ